MNSFYTKTGMLINFYLQNKNKNHKQELAMENAHKWVYVDKKILITNNTWKSPTSTQLEDREARKSGVQNKPQHGNLLKMSEGEKEDIKLI